MRNCAPNVFNPLSKFTMRDAKLSYESLFYFSLQKRQKKAVMRIIVGLCKIIKIIGSIMVSGGN